MEAEHQLSLLHAVLLGQHPEMRGGEEGRGEEKGGEEGRGEEKGGEEGRGEGRREGRR